MYASPSRLALGLDTRCDFVSIVVVVRQVHLVPATRGVRRQAGARLGLYDVLMRAAAAVLS